MGSTDRVWVAGALQDSWVWKEDMNRSVLLQKKNTVAHGWPTLVQVQLLRTMAHGQLLLGQGQPRGFAVMDNPCQGSDHAQNNSQNFLLVGSKLNKIICFKTALHRAHSLV